MEEPLVSPPPPESEDLERLMRASDLAHRAATLVRHAKKLANQATRPYMPWSQFLEAAAESVDQAATALQASNVVTRPKAAVALLRACVKLSMAASRAGLEKLAEEGTDTADEAAEVMRLAFELKEVVSFQPQRGWLRRFGSWCLSPAPPPRATSRECQAETVCFALSGAINLLPYMGRAGVLKDTTAYTNDYLWWLSLIFSSIWGTLGASLHAQDSRYRLVVGFGRVCPYAATLGLTILVCFFCSWMLSPASSRMLTVLCVFFATAHVLLWLARRRGDA